jgi:transcriptional regulator with XRE-family HTH domain
MARNKETLEQFAARVGVTRSQLGSWLRNKGQTLSSRFLAALAENFAISYEQAVGEAGGVTAEQRAAQVLRDAPWRKKFTADDYRKSGQSRRGTARNPAAVTKSFTTFQENGAFERWRDAGKKYMESRDGRVVQSFIAWRRHHPKHSAKERSERARIVAAKYTAQGLKITTEVVLALWRPYVPTAGGQSKKRGRPEEKRWSWIDTRYEVALYEAFCRGATRPSGGFWDQINARCIKRGEENVPSAQVLRSEHAHYRRRLGKPNARELAALFQAGKWAGPGT